MKAHALSIPTFFLAATSHLSLTDAALRHTSSTTTTTLEMIRDDMSSNPDYDFVRDLGMNPEAEFDLMVKHGLLKPNQEGGAALDVQSFQGEVQLTELAEGSSAADRETQLLNLCGTIETLFGNGVNCDCSARIALGLVGFTCTSWQIQETSVFEYEPQFFGTFTFRLFAMEYTVNAGVCANGLGFVSEEFGFLNLGNMCVTAEYKITYSREGGLTRGISECIVDLGFYAGCDCKVDCDIVNEDGTISPGVKLTCGSEFNAPFDFVETPCIALGIPFARSDRATTKTAFMEAIADANLLEGIMMQAEADARAKIAAEEEPEEEPDQDEEEPDEEEPDEKCKGKDCDNTEDEEEEPDQDEEEPDEPDQLLPSLPEVPEEKGRIGKAWEKIRNFFRWNP